MTLSASGADHFLSAGRASLLRGADLLDIPVRVGFGARPLAEAVMGRFSDGLAAYRAVPLRCLSRHRLLPETLCVPDEMRHGYGAYDCAGTGSSERDGLGGRGRARGAR